MTGRGDSTHLPVRSERGDMEVPGKVDGLDPCPSCGRPTATVGRGTCADCWQAKTPEGEPAVRFVEPKTLPLLGPINDVPDWIWLGLVAAVGGLVVGALLLL